AEASPTRGDSGLVVMVIGTSRDHGVRGSVHKHQAAHADGAAVRRNRYFIGAGSKGDSHAGSSAQCGKGGGRAWRQGEAGAAGVGDRTYQGLLAELDLGGNQGTCGSAGVGLNTLPFAAVGSIKAG